MLKQCLQWLDRHPELASDFERRFIPALMGQVRQNGWCLTLRQQFYLQRTHKAIRKRARRAGVALPPADGTQTQPPAA